MLNSTNYAASMNITMKRDTSLDLLRIISMIMVVCLHTVGWGGLVEGALIPGTGNWYLGNAMQALSLQAVNCFVLISGYFLCTSQFRLGKLVSTWVQAVFYSVGVYLQCWCIYYTGACPQGGRVLDKRTDKVRLGCHNGQILVCD